MQPRDWPAEIHRELAAAGVRVVGYVPDRLELPALERSPSSRAWVAEIVEDHVRPVPVIPVRRIR